MRSTARLAPGERKSSVMGTMVPTCLGLGFGLGFGVAAVAGAYLQAEVVDLEAPRLAEEAEVLACSP